ncbi:hypothetical protein ACWC9T_19385 [Kitasatospora sp. NPDC001159]
MRPTSPSLPSARRLSAAATVAAALTLGGAPATLAAPGDNGDVEIHSGTTPVTDTRDERKVCKFYLDAFNFDTVHQVNWTIEQQQPTGTAPVRAGQITLTNGTGATAVFTLPNGHYKLVWTFSGESGTAKRKLFEVSCATSSPSPSPSHSPTHSPGHSPSTSPTRHEPHGGVGTGGGGTSGANAAEVIGGGALVVGAGGLTIRAMRRRPGRDAES